MTEQAAPTRLFNRNILLLIQGQAVSLFGSQAFYIAITFWIKHVSNSPALMGTYLMVTGLPAILLGPVAGTVADRYGRRWILVVCDLICAITMIALAALLLSSGRTGTDTLAWVFAASIVLSVCGCFFQPAINSMIPDLVPTTSLMRANSALGAISQLVIFAGKALGGILLRVLGAPLMFLLDGLSYLFSAITELFVREPPRPPAPELQRTVHGVECRGKPAAAAPR